MRPPRLAIALAICLFTVLAHAAPRRTQLHLPGVRQATDWTCGPASVLSILHYFAKGDETEMSLARKMRANSTHGTAPARMSKLMRGMGLDAKMKQGMTVAELKRHLRAGRPVIVNLQAWPVKPNTLAEYRKNWNDGHYVVAIGFDKRGFTFMDPSIGGARGHMTEQELLARWHDVDTERNRKYYRLGIAVGAKRGTKKNEARYTRTQHLD